MGWRAGLTERRVVPKDLAVAQIGNIKFAVVVECQSQRQDGQLVQNWERYRQVSLAVAVEHVDDVRDGGVEEIEGCDEDPAAAVGGDALRKSGTRLGQRGEAHDAVVIGYGGRRESDGEQRKQQCKQAFQHDLLPRRNVTAAATLELPPADVNAGCDLVSARGKTRAASSAAARSRFE
jgi:hypothetical protein